MTKYNGSNASAILAECDALDASYASADAFDAAAREAYEADLRDAQTTAWLVAWNYCEGYASRPDLVRAFARLERLEPDEPVDDDAFLASAREAARPTRDRAARAAAEAALSAAYRAKRRQREYARQS